MIIGDIIRNALRKKKISQVELAQEMGVTRGAVNSWVQNISFPPGEKLIKLAKFLDIVDELFSGDIENTPGENDSKIVQDMILDSELRLEKKFDKKLQDIVQQIKQEIKEELSEIKEQKQQQH